jgi:hypothetical protein
MLYQLVTSGLVSLVNFGIHAVMTGLIVVVTRHIAGRTDDLHVFMRLIALLMITAVALMISMLSGVWAGYYKWMGMEAGNTDPFEFAFENYTALGYGDAARQGLPGLGPITALNGLLLIGWSVAIIFEV